MTQGQLDLQVKPLSDIDKAILAQIPWGRERAIGRVNLATIVGIGKRTLERKVKALIEDHGYSIGSSCTHGESGYFFIFDEEDRDVAYRHIISKAMSDIRRACKVKKLSWAQVMGQLQMEFEKCGPPASPGSPG